MLAQTIIDRAKNEAGFDASDGTVLGWLNERHREMIAAAQSLRAVIDLGPTGANDATYVVPDTVVDLRALKVDGRPYGRVSLEEFWAVDAGQATVNGNGVFAPQYDTVGAVTLVALAPRPTVSGLDIKALVAVEPTGLNVGDLVQVPVEREGDLIAGVIATGLLRLDERPDLAQSFEATFQAGIEKLRRRANSRVGSGAVQARIKGVHW